MPNILIVDDDILSLEFMKLFLESEGHTVLTASTMSEAKDMMEHHRPDMLFTDIELPDGKGSELAKFALTCGIKKVLGITGFDEADIVTDAFHAVLTKPVDFAAIQKHLGTN